MHRDQRQGFPREVRTRFALTCKKYLLISQSKWGTSRRSTDLKGASSISPPRPMETPDLIELISWGDQPLAYLIRAEFLPEKTTFVTPPEWEQQVGLIVRAAGGEIARHAHRPWPRQHARAPEILLVRQGRCQVEIYNQERQLVTVRELRQGDLILLLDGGHGFRLLEDTVFLEIKPGPYAGPKEKVCF